MFFASTVKPLCFTEPSIRVQQKFYSRYPSSLNLKLFNDIRKNIDFTFNKLFPKFQSLKLSSSLKEHSTKILKSCTKQCEFVVAHRIRRSQQIFSLYRKLWGDFRLLLILQKFNANAFKQRKLLFSASLAACFTWEKQRIPEKELSRSVNELNKAKLQFEQDQIPGLEEDVPDIEDEDQPKDFCDCDRCRHLNNGDDWQLFYKSLTMKIWRKEHENYKGQGLYVYKVYGRWNDITAQDFFQVQIDCKYRKEWDQNSVQLYIVESDKQSNSDILYWEFLFPRMFYNRDYVCNRRYKIDHEKKLMTIVSESVEHPSCPEKPPIHRVREYWSHIIIKPKEDFEKLGMEFTITYFDNPGLSIPSYISVLYTASGMPEYIMKQKEAAVNLSNQRIELYNLWKEEEKKKEKEKEKENVQQTSPQPISPKTPEKRFLIL